MPEPPRTVVVDTTPIIALASIQQLGLLGDLYEEILIPPAVKIEVLAHGTRAGSDELPSFGWIREQGGVPR